MNDQRPELQPLPGSPQRRVIAPVAPRPTPAEIRELYRTMTIAYWIEAIAVRSGNMNEAEKAAQIRNRANESIMGAI